jgi:hypothetical protein
MVATAFNDKLAYVFPKSLEEAAEVDHVLRLQRLNVGFSRAKERIHFFVSKPVEEFSGAIGKALQHFQRVLEEAKSAPGPADTDPKSPMERRVLAWLNQTRLMQRFGEWIEIDAQYPIGEYLRQLDPTYQHPNYKVDFLIKIRAADKGVSIILEYDGFKEHFADLDEVDASNYGLYMKPEDVERQKVLESYGYRFLRLNRFNLGKGFMSRNSSIDLTSPQTEHWRMSPFATPFVCSFTLSTSGCGLGACSASCAIRARRSSRVRTGSYLLYLDGEAIGPAPLRDRKGRLQLARGYGRKCQNCKKTGRRRRRA